MTLKNRQTIQMRTTKGFFFTLDEEFTLLQAAHRGFRFCYENQSLNLNENMVPHCLGIEMAQGYG